MRRTLCHFQFLFSPFHRFEKYYYPTFPFFPPLFFYLSSYTSIRLNSNYFIENLPIASSKLPFLALCFHNLFPSLPPFPLVRPRNTDACRPIKKTISIYPPHSRISAYSSRGRNWIFLGAAEPKKQDETFFPS